MLRVFLSSPFAGMTEEREIFVNRFLPILRKMCERCGVLLQLFDLRWGISDEQSQANKIVLICLDAMAQSDVMLGFYASRYGSSAATTPWIKANLELARATHPWIDSYQDRSGLMTR